MTSTVYDDAWRESEETDPKAIVDPTLYDAANQKTSVIENCVQSGSNPDQNQTNEMTWTADTQLKSGFFVRNDDLRTDPRTARKIRTCDVRGLLAKLTSWNNATVGSGSIVNENEYAHNGFMQLTKVAGGNTRHYYYSDQWQVLEERLNALTTADKRFVWGARAVDDLVARNHGSTRHYALSDAMWSVTAIVSTAGTVQERYGYDGFGQPRYMNASFGSRANSSHTWETLFDGYRYDPESGLYQVRYRFLHPRLGRWPTRDPIGERGFQLFQGVRGKRINRWTQEPNLYGFVLNNPANKVDLHGLHWYPPHIPPSQGPILPAKIKRLLMPLLAARSCLCVLCGVALNIEVRACEAYFLNDEEGYAA